MDEQDFSCPICLVSYCEKEFIPRVLNCGHSHCTKCLTRILKDNRRCGECRAVIKRRDVEENPINYAVLRMLDSQKPLNKVAQDFAEFTKLDQQIKSIVQDLDSQKKNYKETIDRLNHKIIKIDTKKKDLEDSKSLIYSKNSEIRESHSLTEIHGLLANTLQLAQKTDQKIKDLDSINFDVLEEKVLPFYELPSDFVVDFGSGAWSHMKRSLDKTKLYISPIKRGISFPPKTTSVSISEFRSHYYGAHLVLGIASNEFTVDVEVFRSQGGFLSARASQFLSFCIGEYGPCLVGSKLVNYNRNGREGESVQGGDYDGKGGKAFVKGIEKGKLSNRPITSGLLAGVQKDKKIPSTMFEMFLEAWPNKKTSTSFGRIIQGKYLLQKALQKAAVLDLSIVIKESYISVDFTQKIKPFPKGETKKPRT